MSYEKREWVADAKARELLKKVLSQERIHYCFAFHTGKAGRFAPFTFTVTIDDGKDKRSIRRNFANASKVERSPDNKILVAKRERKEGDTFPDEAALLI